MRSLGLAGTRSKTSNLTARPQRRTADDDASTFCHDVTRGFRSLRNPSSINGSRHQIPSISPLNYPYFRNSPFTTQRTPFFTPHSSLQPGRQPNNTPPHSAHKYHALKAKKGQEAPIRKIAIFPPTLKPRDLCDAQILARPFQAPYPKPLLAHENIFALTFFKVAESSNCNISVSKPHSSLHSQAE